MSTITRGNAAAFRRPLIRPDPVGPPQAYQTYSVIAPPDRTVVAACEQVGCLAWRHGWETTVDEGTALGRQQAAFIRQRSGRTFRELRRGALTIFRFEARQRCFTEHRTRPTLYIVRNGDHRANLGALRRFDRPDQWVDDMQSTLDSIRRKV